MERWIDEIIVEAEWKSFIVKWDDVILWVRLRHSNVIGSSV
jgi:hypothetical protein